MHVKVMPYKYIVALLLVSFAITAQGQIIQLKKVKNKSEQYYNQALAATQQQRYAEAIELSKKALKEEPNYIDQELLLARLYMLTGQYDLSRKYIKKVLHKDPTYKDAYYYGINVEMTTGRYEEAECYVDEALLNFPGNRDFRIRQINILDAQGKLRRADGYAETLMDNFPEDTVVRRAYINHYLEAGYYHQKNGNYTLARSNFDKVLAVDPNNKDAREATLGTELKGGNRTEALAILDRQLAQQPNNYDLLMKKLGLLQEMHQYAEALSVLQQIYRKYPNDAKARSIESALRMEAAAYYANADPYTLYTSVLEKNPNNREALDKVIGYAMSRGAYMEALAWINRGLRTNPADSRLLGFKLDILEADHKYSAAAAIAEMLYRRSPNADLKERLTDLQLRAGRAYLQEEQYDLALAAFQSGLQTSPQDTNLLSLVTNTYLLLKDNKGALKAVDNALAYYPDNEKFLLRKAAILEASGKYEAAAELLGQLSARHPGDEKYKGSLVDLRLSMGRNLMRAEEYEAAKQQFAAVLAAQPDNRDALDYMINMQSATGKADSAVYYADNALIYYPNDKDLLLKKAGALQQLGQNTAAAAITADLMARYPYLSKYRDAYTNSLLAAASAYQKAQQADSALYMYQQVLALNPKDSLALQSSINLLNAQQRYDSALAYVQEGLRYYPDNEALLLKRAVTLENRKDYSNAALAADTLARKYPTAANKDYYDQLYNKTLRNQFGLYYLNSSYDYTSNKYNIATVEYRRLMKRGGSYAFRLDYAGRKDGNGLQGEAEMYYVHNPKLYSYGLVTYSNKVVFPQLRAGYSLFKTFGKEVEGELGVRYLNLDSLSSIAGVASIAKPFGDFWVNFRAYVISEESDVYTSFNLTTRYYTDARRQDFVSLIAGIGTSPDDRSRLINLPELSGLLTHSVAAGYQKVIKYRTTLGLYGTWINSKIADNQYRNQYDIYLLFMRKF